jgi:hypothetical protein
MQIFYWITGVLFGAAALPSAFYFVAYILTGEDACQQRARSFYRWAALIGLATFNIVIFKHVVGIIIDMMR